MGHQLLARAFGCRTFKLSFGHHGANHPVLERETGRVRVTSQNHNFAVAVGAELPAGLEASHESLFDRTNEGLIWKEHPIRSVQFHPEASPGPRDSLDLLSAFVEDARQARLAAPRRPPPRLKPPVAAPSTAPPPRLKPCPAAPT